MSDQEALKQVAPASGDVERVRAALEWLHHYISGYCVITHPKQRLDGTSPEEAILDKISEALGCLSALTTPATVPPQQGDELPPDDILRDMIGDAIDSAAQTGRSSSFEILEALRPYLQQPATVPDAAPSPDCRDAFERGKHNSHGWDMTREGDSYKHPLVEAMWVGFRDGWQARTPTPPLTPEQREAMVEAAVLIEQVQIALDSRKIHDFDTGWRMAEKILPHSFGFTRKKDSAELTCHYRKIHFSDVLDAARKLAEILSEIERKGGKA